MNLKELLEKMCEFDSKMPDYHTPDNAQQVLTLIDSKSKDYIIRCIDDYSQVNPSHNNLLSILEPGSKVNERDLPVVKLILKTGSIDPNTMTTSIYSGLAVLLNGYLHDTNK